MDNKEYIQISKEDFEKLHSLIMEFGEILYRKNDELREIYESLTKIKTILEGVAKKKIRIELDEAKDNIDHIRYELIRSYSYLNNLIEEILEKAKKEQIDKKENE